MVNVASRCGFTVGHYNELNALVADLDPNVRVRGVSCIGSQCRDGSSFPRVHCVVGTRAVVGWACGNSVSWRVYVRRSLRSSPSPATRLAGRSQTQSTRSSARCRACTALSRRFPSYQPRCVTYDSLVAAVQARVMQPAPTMRRAGDRGRASARGPTCSVPVVSARLCVPDTAVAMLSPGGGQRWQCCSSIQVLEGCVSSTAE